MREYKLLWHQELARIFHGVEDLGHGVAEGRGDVHGEF